MSRPYLIAGVQRDYLYQLLDLYYPLHFFALFRAHELYNVEPYIDLLQPPVLDLGCGDGLVASLLFDRQLEYGIDISKSAVMQAHRQNKYRAAFVGGAHNLPLPDERVNGVFSNCVLEHIPDIDKLINEVARVLRPGGYFVTTCLSPYYYTLNPVFQWFDKPGLRWLRQEMITEENRLHNHVSVLSVDEYRRILAENDMTLEMHQYYAPAGVARFCSAWDTLSKYSYPYPRRLQHRGLLVKYLARKYDVSSKKQDVLDEWYDILRALCYDRNPDNMPGVGQIIVARKCGS